MLHTHFSIRTPYAHQTLAHLHNERTRTAWESTNVIEAGDFVRASEKEWYYTKAGDTERYATHSLGKDIPAGDFTDEG